MCIPYTQQKADVDARGGSHEYPIVAAVVGGAERIVSLLAAIGKAAEPKNAAALKAVVLGRPQMLEWLLVSGADVSYVKDAKVGTLAHRAVKNDDVDCLRILAKYGADLDARDISGMTPLHLATSCGFVSCMVFFLSQGANIEARDNNSNSPLLTAAMYGQVAALVLLLGNGAEVDICSEAGTTALCYASASLSLPMVISLLEHGANPNRQTKLHPDSKLSTPLHTLAMEIHRSSHNSPNTMAIVDALLEFGADPNIPDADGRLAEDKTSNPELKKLLHRWSKNVGETTFTPV